MNLRRRNRRILGSLSVAVEKDMTWGGLNKGSSEANFSLLRVFSIVCEIFGGAEGEPWERKFD